MAIPAYEDYDFGYMPCCGYDDFHSVETIQLGQLIHDGWFNWKEEEGWIWDYYDLEQKERLQTKIDNHYYWREIGIIPPLQWKMEFLRKLNEIMPKYKYLYKMLAEEDFDPFSKEQTRSKTGDSFDEWYKSRDINSDFPQTLLKGNSDYASDGKDREYEKLHTLDKNVNSNVRGDILDKWEQFFLTYQDPDAMIIEELDPLFGHLVSLNLNVW